MAIILFLTRPATLTEFYKNPDGVSRPACTYCGYCHAGCMIGAKAQPTNVLMPVIAKHKGVSIRTGTRVRRIVHEGNKQARGVTYLDAAGEEVFQPAELVFLGAWTFSNTRLLLVSGIGQPYDPVTGKGTLGRNLTHELTLPAARVFLDKPLNRFMGTGSAGDQYGRFEWGPYRPHKSSLHSWRIVAGKLPGLPTDS